MRCGGAAAAGGVGFPQWVDVWTSTKWRPAQIQEENEKQFKVAFEFGAEAAAEWIDRESPRLAPHWSRARAYFGQWRRDLKVGSRVDGLDTVHKWYTGHVMEVQGDFLHLNYDGWAAKFNEWISRTSDRLAEWRTQGIIVENVPTARPLPRRPLRLTQVVLCCALLCAVS